MEISTFLEQIAEQFDDLDGTALSADAAFRDIPGWCSIVALSIIAMVDEEYGVALTGDDIRQSKTIKDIFEVVHRRAC